MQPHIKELQAEMRSTANTGKQRDPMEKRNLCKAGTVAAVEIKPAKTNNIHHHASSSDVTPEKKKHVKKNMFLSHHRGSTDTKSFRNSVLSTF